MGRKKGKIYIVDDEKDFVRLVARRIQAMGYEVAYTHTGKSAMGVIQASKPDLILLDIWLPDVSGLELFKKLRRHPDTRHIPILFISADVSKEERTLVDLKAEGFIRKPYDPSQLREIIDKNIKKQ